MTNITKAFWSDGSESSIAFGLWGDNQPSLEQGKCGSLKYSAKHKQWKWTLNQCDKREAFVCQMPACPKGWYRILNSYAVTNSFFVAVVNNDDDNV